MSNDPRGPIFTATGTDAPRTELPFKPRDAITAIVYDPKTKRYLCLRWKEVDWETFVTGGIEIGQTPEGAARTELCEETGWKHFRLVAELPRFQAKFYHHPKGENRWAYFRSFLFELLDDERDLVSEEEQAKHECVWLSEEELRTFRLPEGQRFVFEHVLTLTH